MKTLYIFLLLFFTFLDAKTIFTSSINGEKFRVVEIKKDLGVVWGMSYLDLNRVLCTIRDGKAFILELDSKKIKYLKGLPDIRVAGQGGLLDVKISPNFKKDGWIYFTYVKDINSKGITVLARAKLKKDSFYNWQDLLLSDSMTNSSVHFGSRITFDEKGFVYFSVGDRGERFNAQNLSNHAGKILRLKLDGSIPKDNPFYYKKDVRKEIYSYGHRNPQGIFYDKKTKTLYAIEHGPKGGDEINIIKKAQNYGWPVITYGKEYFWGSDIGEGTHKKGMVQPIKYYVPSIAPSSLIVYSGKVFKTLEGKLLAGALKLRHLNIIDPKTIKEQRILEDLGERIRNIVESPSGILLISTDSGRILELKK